MAGEARVARPLIGAANSTLYGLAVAAGFVVAYVLVFGLTNVLANAELTVSPWNPETGLTFAAGVWFGLPGLVLAALARVAAIYAAKPYFNPSVDIPSVCIHVLAFALPGALARRHMALGQHAAVSVVVGLVTGTLVAATLAAALQVILMSVATGFDAKWFVPSVATLGVGDFIGVITVAPLLVVAGHPRAAIDAMRARPAAAAVMAGIIVTIAYFVFGVESTDQFKVFYVVFIPVIISAIGGGFTYAMLAILASDTAMMTIIYLRGVSVSTATELQFFMATLAVTGLALGALVSDRRRMEQQLSASITQLQESQAALFAATRRSLVSEMAAALSHELSQPLTSARNYVRSAARLLERPEQDTAQIQQLVRDAVMQIDAAGELIRETRSFLESGDSPMAAIDLRQLLEQCKRMVDAELRQSGISIRIGTSPDLPAVLGNRTQIQQVILNLIRNGSDSINASGRGDGSIRIGAAFDAKAGTVKVSVRDNGPGVPEESRAMLFMPLNSTKAGGLGLGLSLCRSILLAHGGDIWLASTGPTGAVFMFTLKPAPQARA